MDIICSTERRFINFNQDSDTSEGEGIGDRKVKAVYESQWSDEEKLLPKSSFKNTLIFEFYIYRFPHGKLSEVWIMSSLHFRFIYIYVKIE